MRNLFISSILTLAVCAATFAQINETSPCPTINLSGPAGIPISGETINFKVDLIENGGNPVNYYWTVSGGTIIEGQGTTVISVATNSDVGGKVLSATIEINGLPANRKNTASEKVQFSYNDVLPVAVDDYGRMPFRDEKLRLDNVAFELKNNKDYIAHFLIYIPEKDEIETVKSRVSKITNYLNANQ